MGEVVHQFSDQVTEKFKLKAHLSLAGIVIAGGLGLVGIVATVNEVDGHLAVFIGGVAALASSVSMITNWGASEGHADLAQLAVHGHERLNEAISDGFNEVEQIERETGSAVVIALDELRERRRRNGG